MPKYVLELVDVCLNLGSLVGPKRLILCALVLSSIKQMVSNFEGCFKDEMSKHIMHNQNQYC